MKSLFTTIASLLVCLSVFAQEPLSLARAIEIGLANNFQLEIAKRNLELAENNNTWSAAGRGPRVDASLNVQNGYLNSRAAGFLQEQSALSTGITPAIDGTWLIYDGNRAKISKQQLEELEGQGQLNVAAAIENTVQSVILAYYQSLIQEEQLRTLQEVLDLSRDRINYQEVRKEFGQAGSFDILQTTDAYLSDSTNILVQKNNVATTYRNLNLAMGEEDMLKVYTLTEDLNFQPSTFNLENLQTAMHANNKTLQNLMIARELANMNTKLQETAKRPTLSLGAGLSYAFSGSAGDGIINTGEIKTPIDLGGTTKNFNFYLGATAAYNLYDGGTRKRNIENANVEEMIAQMNIQDLKRNLNSQLQNALANYNNQVRLVQLTENLIENARNNLAISKERFEGGLISSFDYRAIQLAFVNASQAKLTALYNLKTTETELMRLTGQLVDSKG